MAHQRYIRMPDQSIVASALQLYNDIIAHDNCRRDNNSRAPCVQISFLEKMKIIEDSRRRAFSEVEFCEPCWNIIVSLAIDLEHGKNTSIKDACFSSGVSATTTLRCLSKLENVEILRRSIDPYDGRRVFLRLTDRSKHIIDAWLINSLRTIGLVDASESNLNCIDIESSNQDF